MGGFFAARGFTQHAIARTAEYFGMEAPYLERPRGSIGIVCEGPLRYARDLYNNLTTQNVVGFELYCNEAQYEALTQGPDAAYPKSYAAVVRMGPHSPMLDGGKDAFGYDRRTLRGGAEDVAG